MIKDLLAVFMCVLHYLCEITAQLSAIGNSFRAARAAFREWKYFARFAHAEDVAAGFGDWPAETALQEDIARQVYHELIWQIFTLVGHVCLAVTKTYAFVAVLQQVLKIIK